MTLRNFYLSTFKGRNCWVKKFFDKKIDVNILTPTTFFDGEPGYFLHSSSTYKLDSVVGEEVCLKLLFS